VLPQLVYFNEANVLVTVCMCTVIGSLTFCGNTHKRNHPMGPVGRVPPTSEIMESSVFGSLQPLQLVVLFAGQYLKLAVIPQTS